MTTDNGDGRGGGTAIRAHASVYATVDGDEVIRPARRRHNDPLWAKLVIAGGLLIMMASGVVAVVPGLVARWAIGEIDQVSVIPPEMRGADVSGAINFLLLGTDGRTEATADHTGLNADSMVLVHIPASHDKVYMISLPRDLRVQIPRYEVTREDGSVDVRYSGGVSKLNAAFGAGAEDTSAEGRGHGAVLVMKTIDSIVSCAQWDTEPGWVGQRCTSRGDGPGLAWHGSAVVNFDGFEAVVRAVGSVYMCIDEDVYSIHYWPDGRAAGNPLWRGLTDAPADGDYGDGYHYEQGWCGDMEPWQALDYSRQRYGFPNGDYSRQRHQQQLLKAIVAKVASTDTLTNLTTIGRLRAAVGSLLTLDLAGNAVEDWVWTMRNLRSENMTMIATYGGRAEGGPFRGAWYEPVLPDLVELLHHVRDDTVGSFLNAHPDWLAQDAGPAQPGG